MELLNIYISCCLVLIAYKDYKTCTIPNTYVGLLSLGTFTYYVIYKGDLGAWLGFLLVGGLFLVLYLFTNGLGAGDVKLAMALVWWLGYPQVFIFLYLAVVFGGIWAVGVALVKKRRKVLIPFAPSICLSSVTTYYLGEKIWQWWGNWLCG